MKKILFILLLIGCQKEPIELQQTPEDHSRGITDVKAIAFNATVITILDFMRRDIDTLKFNGCQDANLIAMKNNATGLLMMMDLVVELRDSIEVNLTGGRNTGLWSFDKPYALQDIKLFRSGAWQFNALIDTGEPCKQIGNRLINGRLRFMKTGIEKLLQIHKDNAKLFKP